MICGSIWFDCRNVTAWCQQITNYIFFSFNEAKTKGIRQQLRRLSSLQVPVIFGMTPPKSQKNILISTTLRLDSPD